MSVARMLTAAMQGFNDEYVPGTCEQLLKWKFAHLNSVDFLLRIHATGMDLAAKFQGSSGECQCLWSCQKKPILLSTHDLSGCTQGHWSREI